MNKIISILDWMFNGFEIDEEEIEENSEGDS